MYSASSWTRFKRINRRPAPTTPSVSTTAARLPVQVFAEVLHPTTARVVGRWERDYLKDSPAATEQPFGKGKAVYYGSLFNLDAARCLIKRYAGETGLKPLLADVPEQVEVTRRTKGGDGFLFSAQPRRLAGNGERRRRLC